MTRRQRDGVSTATRNDVSSSVSGNRTGEDGSDVRPDAEDAGVGDNVMAEAVACGQRKPRDESREPAARTRPQYGVLDD